MSIFEHDEFHGHEEVAFFNEPHTGLRAIIELIEELVLTGGGHGLFTGCAAGDSAAAIVLKVDVG